VKALFDKAFARIWIKQSDYIGNLEATTTLQTSFLATTSMKVDAFKCSVNNEHNIHKTILRTQNITYITNSPHPGDPLTTI
ncbi:hypothetical protein DRH29_04515, partial [candidate division Kazan bacterium]